MNNSDIPSLAVLAFDSSGLTCSAAVIKNGRVLSSVFSNNGLTHSRTLLPSVETVLKESSAEWDEIDAIAVTVGPGSFTGVKIGVATAKGLAFPKNLPCFSVSSMAALACGARGFEGIVCPVSDARRGMLYNALFLSGKDGVKRICDDRQISAGELAGELAKEDRSILVTGDGADILRDECEKAGIAVASAAQNVSFIRPEGIFEALMNGLYEEKKPEELTAVYLRPPQAERERNERIEEEKRKKESEEAK